MKIAQFIVLAYAISWSVAGAMHLAGIEYGSFASLATIAFLYMAARMRASRAAASSRPASSTAS